MGVSRPQKQDLSHSPGGLCSGPPSLAFLLDTSGLWFTSRFKASATRQFFNLHLDIQSNKIRTVQDTMGSLVARESGLGDTTKTEQEMEISWRVTLEKLFCAPAAPPAVRVAKTGVSQKLIRNAKYPADMEISKDCSLQGLKIRTLNATEPIGCFQWSTTTAAVPCRPQEHLPDQAQGLEAH